MRTADFHYELPPGQIAQQPPAERAAARMLVLDRATGSVAHACVRELPRFVRAGDVLVFNNSRVIPARLLGRWADTGGAVEFLLLEPAPDPATAENSETWDAMSRTGRRLRAGLQARVGRTAGMAAEVLAVAGAGRVRLRLWPATPARAFADVLAEEGLTPLPPYIRRDSPDVTPEDRARYQTVYADPPGSVAAPTAGLHFDDALLGGIRAAGAACAMVTLHVGPGTFLPVKAERVEDHVMHSERYAIATAAATAVNRAKAGGGRVIAVGSTSLRTLESAAAVDGAVRAGDGRTDLFIRPGYTFRVVDALLTNFHLPCSTLLMMVCAFAGQGPVMAAYAAAVREGYRFYSYGDCMLIL